MISRFWSISFAFGSHSYSRGSSFFQTTSLICLQNPKPNSILSRIYDHEMDNVIHSPASHSIIASTRPSNCNLFHSFMNSFQHHANVLPGRRKFNQKNPSPSHRRRRINMHTNNPSTGGFACTKLHKATEALSCPGNETPHYTRKGEKKILQQFAPRSTKLQLKPPLINWFLQLSAAHFAWRWFWEMRAGGAREIVWYGCH